MIDQSILQELETVDEVLVYLLNNFPESRKNGNAIIAVYMREIWHIELTDEQVEYITNATSLRTVIRVRAKQSNQDNFFPFVKEGKPHSESFKQYFKPKHFREKSIHSDIGGD